MCVVEYYSKSPIVKKAVILAADDMVKRAKIIFAEFGLPKKKYYFICRHEFNIRNVLTVFRQLNTEEAISSSYLHESYGWMEVGVKFIKCTINKCLDLFLLSL